MTFLVAAASGGIMDRAGAPHCGGGDPLRDGSDIEVTADVRNHGPSGRYHGSYSDGQLGAWAERIRKRRREGRDVWCFFDNDFKSAAPADARRLLDMLDRPARGTQTG